MPELSERLFTKEDVEIACKTSIITKFNNQFGNIYKKIHAKIQQDPKPNYYYHKDKFDKIYAISDIHADYKALLRHLVKFEFIKYDEKSGLNFENIDTDEFDIYNPKLISDVKWVKSNTLLVICGDIVDGCRTNYDKNKKSFEIGEVNDTEGTFEILLHMFLRNLKLQAQDNTSDVMLIVGNHDNVTDKPFWNTYVHSTAKKFFKSIDKREKILTPFYKNFSLFFGIINEEHNTLRINDFDILFTHGGIIYLGKNFLYDTFEDQIEVTNNNTDIMKIIVKYAKQLNDGATEGPNALWTRHTDGENIPTIDDPKCNRYIDMQPTIVVGHCPTAGHNPNVYKQPEDDNRICSTNDHGFCIYPKCFEKVGKKSVPKVVNIDTSMSGAFKENTPEKMKAFEMLKIYKGEEKGDFNKYTTVSINKEGSIVEYDLENVYNELVRKKQSESPSGGKTRRRKRKTSNKSKRSKRIKKSKQTRKRGRKTRR